MLVGRRVVKPAQESISCAQARYAFSAAVHKWRMIYMGNKFPWGWLLGGVLVLAFFGVISIPGVNLSAIGGGGATVDTSDQVQAESAQFVTDSVILTAIEAQSESPSAADGGSIELFTAGVSPSDASAVVLATIELNRAYTTANVVCGKQYRVAYNNASQHYAADLGDQVLIDCGNEYNENTGDSYVDMTQKFGLKPLAVATLSDTLDETVFANINGGTDGSESFLQGNATVELGNGASIADMAADGRMNYSDTTGDGSVYVDFTFAATGSNSGLKDYAICAEWDTALPPEGTEFTDITLQLRTGTDFGFASGTQWENIFANQDCVKAGLAPVPAGSSGTYRMTMTVAEANTDQGADLFSWIVNDLGEQQGLDARNNAGATRDAIAFSLGTN